MQPIKKYKKILAFLIIFSSIFVSFLIVQNKNETVDYVFKVVPNPKSIENSLKKPPTNITALFTNESLNAIILKNNSVGELDNSNIKKIPEKDDVNKIISEIVDKNTNAEIIDIAQIRVNEKNSKEVQLAYLLFVDYLLKDPRDFPKPKDDSVPEFFRSTSEGFKKKVDLLSVIYVPSSWVDIHQKILQFLTDQKNIYFSLASGNDDPLRFIIATKQILLSETEQQIEFLKGLIRERAYEEKII